MPPSIIASLCVYILSIFVALYSAKKALEEPITTGKLQGLSKAVEEALGAYLARQYRILSIALVILFGTMAWAFGWTTALGFALGAGLSGSISYAVMQLSTKTNIRVAQAALKSKEKAANTALYASTASGVLILSSTLLSALILSIATNYSLDALAGFAAGSTVISVISRLGGGIFTKAADVGADLAGKLETGIPEDDPRNPASIADNVGDTIGNSGAFTTDIIETVSIILFGTILLGRANFMELQNYGTLPFISGAASLFVALIILGVLSVKKHNEPNKAPLLISFLGASILTLSILYPTLLLEFVNSPVAILSLVGVLGTGIVTTLLILVANDYYTSSQYRPVRSIAIASQSGQATNLITGLALSQRAPTIPILLILPGLLFSFYLAGPFGIAIMSLGILLLAPIITSFSIYGPILDAADGLASMATLEENARERTSSLNITGNTLKSFARVFLMLGSLLAALVLFVSTVEQIVVTRGASYFSLTDPFLISGILIGGLIPYYYSSLLLNAVARTAEQIVKEVRRQFREISGVIDGTARPDYKATADIASRSSVRLMTIPALIPLALPLIFGFLVSASVINGIAIGSIVTGVILGLSMIIGGSAWNNAKKHIEEGHYGGVDSHAYEAAIIGDTVGDPFKDTAGPALGGLIKYLNLVAFLVLPFIV